MWGVKDKVVIITGAGNGIGRATADVFAAEGAVVVVADVDGAAAEKAAGEITAAGRKAFAVQCDVSQSSSVQKMVEAVVARYQRIDILHANAAVQINKEATEITEQEWDLLHSVNLKGVFLTCKYVALVMRRQKKGAIIISSSGHALVTYPNCSAYAATKGGELAYMRGLALDLAKDGIRVNCIIPGATDTRLVRGYIEDSANPEETRRKLLDSIPLKRLATPEEVGRGVLFLASEFAGYITGTSLAVDGGILAQG
ncbi:MAG: glucose 1-dehydrogenase [Acidobacteria bacterium]|jgi:3-oxoacyl-[acyl-carrier protein] reductase|nr:glucose 1-dehydrogenase [Acidobacteriota bacterium]